MKMMMMIMILDELLFLVVFSSSSLANALIVSRSSTTNCCRHRRRTSAAADLSDSFHRYLGAASFNSCPSDDFVSDKDAIDSPNLRSLYYPLPKIDDNGSIVSNDGKNSTQIPKWVKKVTSGKLPTEKGSPHELYFEVHHRFPFIKEDACDSFSGDSTLHIPTTKRPQRGLVGLVLHGGPGAGCFPKHTQFFSPDLYEYVVLLDQRGSGRSSPLGEVKYNRLELLVKDVEMLRLHLIKEKLISSCFDNDEESEQKSNSATQSPQHNHHPWDVILGGSWGCTLAMAYAHTYPNSVRAMVLRGLCLFRKREIDWLFGNPPKLSVTIATNDMRRTSNLRDLVAGKSSSSVSMAQSVATVAKSTNVEKQSVAAQFFPQQWKDFSSAVEHDEKNNSRSVLHAYYHLLLGTDVQKKYQALTPWFRWEMGIYGNGFKTSQENEDKNRLLVWYPSSASWKCEDARVKSRKSVDSINVIDVPNNTRDDILRSLRRFYTSSSDASLDVDEKLFEPLPVENTQAAESGQETEINMPDNATINFIPAQAMLTCYYSVNGDYCIQPYNSFLSLNPPPSIPFSSWYSSELPPSSSCESSISSYSSFPLPPTIAIQGGNDAICPPDTALDLHKVWKQLELRLALAGGHSMYDPVIAGEIVKSLDRFGHALMRGGDHTMYDETQATQDTQ